jgi:acyl carrier protein
VDYSLVTDLVEEKILDSLDSLMFLLALSELSGKEFPEDLDLVEAGLYRVDNLVQYLMAA